MTKPQQYAPGFTLSELLVTITIAAIVTGIAVPSFTSLIADNRQTTVANEWVATLNLARSEAVKRGLQITVRRKGVLSSEWESGWDVFVDNNGNNVFDDNGGALCEMDEDCLLKSYDALPRGFTLRTAASPYQDFVAYLPSGLRKIDPNEANIDGAFTLCSESGDSVSQRIITINATGRPSVSATTDDCP